MTIEMFKVDSSMIAAIGYGDGLLNVQFTSGKTYQYTGFSQDTFNEMLESSSIGRYYNSLIRGSEGKLLTEED